MAFRDRADAGRQLAERLSGVDLASPVVLGMPRGGVPVAAEVADVLDAPLDVLVARKIGAPGQEELGVGAVAEGLDEPVISAVAFRIGLTAEDVRQLAVRTQQEVARRVLTYRGGRPALPVGGMDVLLVDDGLATGVTAEAALRALRHRGPRSLRFAAPVGAPESIIRLAGFVDELVLVLAPERMHSVGEWYADFTQTTDEEVRRLLGRRTDEFRSPPTSPDT